MNDISKRARELIEHLDKNGFKDFDVPEAEEGFKDGWNEHYALITKLYVDYLDAADDAGDYFDSAQLEYDFRSMLEEWFQFGDEKAVLLKSNPNHYEELKKLDRVIVVDFQPKCDELEVYRLVHGKTPEAEEA